MEINSENSNKKRLGRGLGSLLGGGDIQGVADYSTGQLDSQEKQNKKAQATISESSVSSKNDMENKVWNIAIDKIVPGVYQPRKRFNKEAIQELADSIKQNGILQPITVRKRSSGGFEIIAGERRWRASQLAGLHEVPALIKQVGDKEALQLALIENIQREDLDPIEEAESFQRLIEEFSLSQQEAAEKVGKERSSVANALRLLSLPRELKEMVSLQQISTGHAKVLLSIQDKTKQLQLAKLTVDKGLSVRALENTIKLAPAIEKNSDENDLKKIDIANKLVKDLADQVQKRIGTKVEIQYKTGKGKIEIQFYSDDQLTQIIEKLKA